MSLESIATVPTQADLFGPGYEKEDQRFLSEQLITYIGNKRKLLPLIESAIRLSVDRLKADKVTFADVFAGTGVVSRMARQWSSKLYINDFEDYSAYSNSAYHSNKSEYPIQEVEEWRKHINEVATLNPSSGFITELYSPEDEDNISASDRVFYSRRNAMFIDTARSEIDKVPIHLQPYLLAPLLQRASVHVNTSGVFKGFYKNKQGIGQFGNNENALQRIMFPIEIPPIILSKFDRKVTVRKMDAVDFAVNLPDIDVAYLDPPYNQHPYGSNYFMLNLILKNKKPEEISRVSGIPKIWQRSPYNVKAEAAQALEKVVDRCPAKIVLISYNSEGFISPDEMISMLESRGQVEVFDQLYNTFRGCRNLSGRSTHVVEMLFKLEKN